MKIQLLALFQNENFQQVFEYFSNIERVPIDEILITKKDRIIKKSDTPASLNLSVIDILGEFIVETVVLLRINVMHRSIFISN